MKLSPLRQIQDAMIDSVQQDQPIHSVLIGPNIWLGFLLQIDMPGKSEDLKKIDHLDGQPIVSRHMERLQKTTFYNEEYPFYFKLNKHIDDVRVILYPKIV